MGQTVERKNETDDVCGASLIMGTGASIAASNGESFHSLVDQLVNDRMQSLVEKLAHQESSTKRSDGVARQASLPHRPLAKPLNSLRSFALKHHSRQENAYIPQESCLAATKVLNKKSFAGRMTTTDSSSGSGLLDINFDAEATIDRSAGDRTKKKPNLKISLPEANNVSVDDEDWIQVSDDEGDDDDSKHSRKRLNLNHNAIESCVFSQSGTIFVDGFRERGIRVDGIDAGNTRGSRLNMKDRLVILCRLGSGASSVVYKALDLRDMRIVALKMVSIFERSKRRQMVKELATLFQFLKTKSLLSEKELSGPRKPRFRDDHFVVDFFNAFSNVDEGGVALMIEYMDGGSLQDIATAGGCDDEAALASIAFQALTGLNFLHKCAQLHRDLKPANFLISSRGEVKIGDFGILRDMAEDGMAGNPSENGHSSPMHRAHTFVGTATYMSPERIDGRAYSYPSDIWAFGLSMVTVALGRLPIDTRGGYWSILQSIRDEKPPGLPEDDLRFSDSFRDFLSRCLRKEPEQRETAAELLKHPFVANANVEDTNQREGPEAGKAELKQILSAVYTHLQKVQSTSAQVRSQEEASDWNYFFSPLANGENVAVTLRNICFGLNPTSEDGISPKLGDNLFPALSEDDKAASKKRLETLAYQLQLTTEEIFDELQVALQQFVDKGIDENLVTTPRT